MMWFGLKNSPSEWEREMYNDSSFISAASWRYKFWERETLCLAGLGVLVQDELDHQCCLGWVSVQDKHSKEGQLRDVTKSCRIWNFAPPHVQLVVLVERHCLGLLPQTKVTALDHLRKQREIIPLMSQWLWASSPALLQLAHSNRAFISHPLSAHTFF